jgi:hypothetical protein
MGTESLIHRELTKPTSIGNGEKTMIKVLFCAIFIFLSLTLALPASDTEGGYPYVIRPLAPHQLAMLQKEFDLQNHGVNAKLDEYGFVTRMRQRAGKGSEKIDRIDDAVKNTKQWLLKNGRYTGVTSESDLVTGTIEPQKMMIKGKETNDIRWVRIFFEAQKYKGIPLVAEYVAKGPTVTAGRNTIHQIDGHWYPVKGTPAIPKLQEHECRKKIVGMTVYGSDISGRSQGHKINDSEVKEPGTKVIFVKKGPGGLEFHLAWKFKVGSAMSWTFYMDAITGEKLMDMPNFIS